MGDYGQGVSSLSVQAPGSNPPSSVTDSDEISVLVTGFGPFKSNLVNASYLIASSLPSSFTFSPTKDPDATPRRVSIHVHPSPIPVAYSTVSTTIPAITDDYVKTHGRRPDIILHMGIAGMRKFYSVETKAHRDGYLMSDIKGRAGYEDGEKQWKELDLPLLLKAGPAAESESSAKGHLNPRAPDDRFLDAWKTFCPPETDVRISTDAGRYLCEFIFYTSLAVAYQGGHDRNITFLHVPATCLDEDIDLGKEVAIALIKALVTSWSDEQVPSDA
ncbi:peptidase C15, pyroglutamyl peptidase I-like protein [Aspergillus sclerotioniger CBS 115572]|uniref:Peptidase C15, pyroglutamyl peptidase I-like protein n=1 Tax=Aspergillus sclerotioniger CBS 115572 TaxID=1450535 RepID=A0A317WZS1_9EURO|nr:peptidase C15, pyroglutamyl peptidase I-like protein [Aspergillus sclerotioniger CBS 115572]PWY91884.1 peptidase C15, pyroglutamyl peptidase I-like protein [Aspergillus sclerotioniger CBS 115572]